jgi:methyl-accepting chemotaxis protein
MSFLTNLRVLTKVLSIILFLSAVTVGITVLSISSLSSLNDATDRMESIGSRSAMAARLINNLLAINRAETQLAMDPRPESRKQVQDTIEAESKTFRERLKWFTEKTTRGEVKERLAEITTAWASYEKELAGTFRAANAVTDVKISAEMDALRKEALASAVVANAARTKLTALATGLENDVRKITDEATVEYQQISMFLTIAAGVSVLAGLIFGFIVGQFGVAKPLRALVRPLEDIAGGNFNIVVPGVGRKDEVGQIATSVSAMADKVRTTIGEIKASGREVTNASAEISTSTTDLSQRTEEQAASLEETSSAMEELSATVRKNAESAQQASHSASATRDVADRGGQVVAKTVEAMAKIEDSSRKISDIIGVIDEIARQTNLLALNAAVEAARAGEAGRGFAVVASEVRSLAQRSSQAAKDIKELITNSTVQVKEGVDLVNKAGTSLSEIVESIKQVVVIVSDIANASAEQATGIDEINKALTQMDEVTQQNSALVEENAATAKTLEHQAKAMDKQVAFFQIGNESPHVPRAQEPAERPVFKMRTASSKRSTASKQQSVVQLKHTAADSNSGGPVKRMQEELATAVNNEPDWKEF